jgi:hypothetical protein
MGKKTDTQDNPETYEMVEKCLKVSRTPTRSGDGDALTRFCAHGRSDTGTWILPMDMAMSRLSVKLFAIAGFQGKRYS